VKTLIADAHKRVRIPDAQPSQVFAYENIGDGRRMLTEIKAETAEPFPPGSLSKYVTPERDAEMLELLKGCSLELPVVDPSWDVIMAEVRAARAEPGQTRPNPILEERKRRNYAAGLR